MKQSAVEFLVSHLIEYGFDLSLHRIEINQAKEIENRQKGYNDADLKRAFKDGYTIGFRTSIFDVNLKEEKCDEWFEEFVKK
jgi:hypothetical protein